MAKTVDSLQGGGTYMVVVANRIFVAAGKEAEFEARFRGRVHLVDRAPGFVRSEVLCPVTEGAPYVVMTHWEDEASFRAWTASAVFREAHGQRAPADMFATPHQVEMHTVLAD